MSRLVFRKALLVAVFAGLTGCAALGELEERMSAAGGLGPTPKDDAEIAAIDAAQEAKARREAAKLAPPPEQDRPEDPPAPPAVAEAPAEMPPPPPAIEPAAPKEPEPPAVEAPAPPPAQAAAAPRPEPRFTPVGKPTIIAKVDSVQFPAWVERGGVRAPIKASWAIYTSDRIMTGGEGRVGLSFVGEGKMKIGGRADVLFAPNQTSDTEASPPLATVRRGSVLVSSLGAGGTTMLVGDAIEANLASGQMLLQAGDSEDLLALVDGSVLVSGPKLNPGTINKPSSFIRVPRRGRANPLSEASGSRLAQWIAPTQAASGKPELKAEGVWDVSLNSGYNLKKLEGMVCRIQARGVPAEISPVREPGKQVWYRVVVRRFANRNDAIGFLGTAKSMGSTQPWVLLPST